MKSKGKQIRISDTVFEEIQKMAEEYDLDKRSIMNAAVILFRCMLSSGAVAIRFLREDGTTITTMPAPIVFKKRDEVVK